MTQILDATQSSYVAALPCLPAGPRGHSSLTDYFFLLFSQLRPSIFCDIGANQGEVGVRAKSVLPECEVHGFEANPEIYADTWPRTEAARVLLHNIAVSDVAGEVDIFIPRKLSRVYLGGKLVDIDVIEKRDTGKSSLLKRDEIAEYDVVQVPAVSLDGFFADRGPDESFMLWVDVEGAGLRVVQGAHLILGRTKAILIEVEGLVFWQGQAKISALFDMLMERGFEPVLRDTEYDDAQFNVLFVRRELLDAIDLATLSELVVKAHQSTAVERKAKTGVHRIARDLTLTADNVPVLVPCFNNPTYSANMLKQLVTLGFSQISLVDNASTSEEMRDWLATVDQNVSVERLSENLGPKKSIFTKERLATLPRYFCVTDPDLAFNPLLPLDFLAEMAEQTARHTVGKAGFSLDILHRRDFFDRDFQIVYDKCKIWEWEERFWTEQVAITQGGDRIFKALTDTTFALYDQNHFSIINFLSAVRLAGRFTARHLPWYRQSIVPKNEQQEYFKTQNFSFYVE